MAYPSMTDGAILIAWDGFGGAFADPARKVARLAVGVDDQNAPDLSRPT
jgi:hypothetical protein